MDIYLLVGIEQHIDEQRATGGGEVEADEGCFDTVAAMGEHSGIELLTGVGRGGAWRHGMLAHEALGKALDTGYSLLVGGSVVDGAGRSDAVEPRLKAGDERLPIVDGDGL